MKEDCLVLDFHSSSGGLAFENVPAGLREEDRHNNEMSSPAHSSRICAHTHSQSGVRMRFQTILADAGVKLGREGMSGGDFVTLPHDLPVGNSRNLLKHDKAGVVCLDRMTPHKQLASRGLESKRKRHKKLARKVRNQPVNCTHVYCCAHNMQADAYQTAGTQVLVQRENCDMCAQPLSHC